MKKLFFTLVALSFVLPLGPVAQAQMEAGSAKPAGTAKKVEEKAGKSHQITGIVEAVDDGAGTLTVKGRKESISLKMAGERKLQKIHVGDKVLVKYTGETASSVRKVPAKKAQPGKTPKKNASPTPAGPAGKEKAPAEAQAPAEKK